MLRNDKVIQIKYIFIGDKDWGSMKEEIENGPSSLKFKVPYLHGDTGTIMDSIIDPVGSPSRNKVVSGNVCT